MDSLVGFFVFLIQLLFLVLIVGIPLLIITILIANFVYKRLIPIYEKWEQKKRSKNT